MNWKWRVVLILCFLTVNVVTGEEAYGGKEPASVPSPEGIVVYIYGEGAGISEKRFSDEEVGEVRKSGDVGRILDRQSGIETQGEGKGKTWNSLAIRGQSFRETVILINGQKVPESFTLGTVPTESIERVEVIEGPQALDYGSDALGGVVNIVTRRATDNRFHLTASGGDFNSYQFQASTPSFGPEKFKNTLSGSWFSTDGYGPHEPVVDANGVTYLFTDQVHWDLNHAASLDLGADKVTLSTGFFRQKGDSPDADNVIAAGTDQYDFDGRQDAWGIHSTLNDLHDLGDWQSIFSLFGNYSDVLRSNPVGADPTSGVYQPYRNQYTAYGGKLYFSGPTSDWLSQPNLTLEAREEGIRSDLYGEHSRWFLSLMAGGTLKLSDSLRLILSDRLEQHDTYGLVDNPLGTLLFEPDKVWRFHVSVGKGYKEPTYDQLYLPYTDFAALPPDLQAQFNTSPFVGVWMGDKGNPNLKPEQSLSSELGMGLRVGDLSLQLAGFANYYEDLINPAVDPADNFWTYANLDHALFAGTEDSVVCRLAEWLSPYLSFTWISATDDAGKDIQGRMRLKFAAGMELKPEKEWSLDLHARYVDRYQVAAQYLTDLGKPAPATDYWNLSLGVHCRVSEHVNGFFNVENLVNSEMASFQGIPLPGRYFEGGLETVF